MGVEEKKWQRVAFREEGALERGSSAPSAMAVTSSMIFNLSGPQGTHLRNGDNACNKLSRVLGRVQYMSFPNMVTMQRC